MKVKVGNKWYVAEKGQPIMVELTQLDKKNILDMPEDAKMYACFTEDDEMTVEEKREWMHEGRNNNDG